VWIKQIKDPSSKVSIKPVFIPVFYRHGIRPVIADKPEGYLAHWYSRIITGIKHILKYDMMILPVSYDTILFCGIDQIKITDIVQVKIDGVTEICSMPFARIIKRLGPLMVIVIIASILMRIHNAPYGASRHTGCPSKCNK
jgi:ascorbate-specific PTS system EIIC-type component UlaA